MQTAILLLAVGLGFLFGQVEMIRQYADSFVVPFLFIMMYGLFLTIPLASLRKTFSNRKFFHASTLINFVWTPLLAWGLGAIFLADYPALWIGFIMLMVTPCTDWYLAFTNIAKGNMPLAISILPINLILQVILLPIYLLLFAGTIEMIPFNMLVESILIVLVIPFALANFTRFLFRGKESTLHKKIIPFFGTGQIFFLAFAIIAMFASQGTYLFENMEIIYILFVPIILFLL